VSWSREPVAKALVADFEAQLAAAGLSAAVLDRPTFTLTAPAIVVGRPTEVRYSMAALGVDEVVLPVGCVHSADSDDAVSELIDVVRDAVEADRTLGGVVGVAYASGERSWRNVNVAGADYLMADVTLEIQM
jgi:hypothetical protein